MSIIQNKEQRVGVFIDTQNLYHSAKNLYHAKVNFSNVVADAVEGRSLVRAIAYVISTDSGEEKGFFDALEKAGIESQTKPLQIFAGGAKKADWDVGLAIDAVKLASKLDVIVIASGDGDFVPLVEYLKNSAACRVEVIAFGKASSGKLIESADKYIDMSENPRRYLISNNRGGERGERRVARTTSSANTSRAVRGIRTGYKKDSADRLRRQIDQDKSE